MAESTIWWVLAGAVIAVELITGTFYLLMLSMGLIVAGLAAMMGVSVELQLVIASLVSGGSVMIWRCYKLKTKSTKNTGTKTDVNLDIGATVQVDEWRPDGTSTVFYRGANWTALPIAGAMPSVGTHHIVKVEGSRLIIEKS